MLDRFFHITARGSTISTELLAGLTTFLTMVYIVFVNPTILSNFGGALQAEQGAPWEGVFIATCIISAVFTLLMGLVANRPVAMSVALGLNAVVAFGIVLGMGYPWQVGMAVCMLAGLASIVLMATGIRTRIMDAIPLTLRRAMGAGIGLFIAFIGLQNGGVVVHDEGTLLALGPLSSPGVIVALVSIAAIVLLSVLKVRGAFLIGIAIATATAFLCGIGELPTSIAQIPSLDTAFTTFGAPFQLVEEGTLAVVVVITNLSLMLMVFSFLMVDLFETTGTLVAVGEEAGFVHEDGTIEDAKKMFWIDSIGSFSGGLVGSSTLTCYVESGAGIAEGGRTGLSNIVVSVGFVLTILFMPIAGMVPAEATAGALVMVGLLMCQSVAFIDWFDLETAAPAFLMMIMIPLTSSIAVGIGLGVVAHVAIKAFRGKAREVHGILWCVAAAYLLLFILMGLGLV
ncbi:MAG: NCS2 family permease [Coriobacteriia bacterium]|nr:NCS2 family permease [Coriobacteriia bacterium]